MLQSDYVPNTRKEKVSLIWLMRPTLSRKLNGIWVILETLRSGLISWEQNAMQAAQIPLMADTRRPLGAGELPGLLIFRQSLKRARRKAGSLCLCQGSMTPYTI